MTTTSTPPRWRLARQALSVVALSVAGCGQGENKAPPVQEIDRVEGQAPAAVDGVPSVILFEPEGVEVDTTAEAPVVMDQIGMAFDPGVLVVPPGQTVTFRNSENIAHNVQVRRMATDSVLFNVSTDSGSSYEHVLDEAGGYDVICDIHPSMWASIVVDGARFHAVARSDGSFVLEGLPPSAYTVRVWSKDPSLRSAHHVDIAPGRTELSLGGGA
jgi:plastocyanin